MTIADLTRGSSPSPTLPSHFCSRPPLLRAAFLVLIGAFGCAQRQVSSPGETFSAGYIFCDKQPIVTHVFTITNTNPETVKVLKVERNCGCTSFSLEKLQLAPGETTRLTINADVPKGYMPKFASCVLNTDHARFKDWVYTVEFVSLPFVAADPEVLDLGSFSAGGKGADVVKHVALDAFGASKLALTPGMFTVPEEIELQVSPNPKTQRLQQGVFNTKYELCIGLSERGREAIRRNLRSGITSKAIELAVKSRRWSYSVCWQTAAPLATHPSFLSFGNLSDEKGDHSRTVTISSARGGRFRILSVRNPSPGILIESVYDPSNEGASHRLKITARRNFASKERFLTGSIQVETTDILQPIVDIRWSANLDRPDQARVKADRVYSRSESGL
jgi:Protein of unknown function (DUF1573)